MCNLRRISEFFKRVSAIGVFCLLIAVSASAYTLVMRDGRRLEIPARFFVTHSTLTYEVQAGIQVTMQISTIDIHSTERANNEVAGSFFRRGQPRTQDPQPATGMTTTRAGKTITNRDLESSARRRIASEQAYEKRLTELGLPSLTESRRQADEASAVAQNELHQRVAAEKESEEYWRSRATNLRTEMAETDAELDYVRRKIDETAYQNWGGGVAAITQVLPSLSLGRLGGAYGVGGNYGMGGSRYGYPRGHRPSVYSAPTGIVPPVRYPYGTVVTRGRVYINPFRWPQRRIGTGPYVGALPNATVFDNANGYDYTYQREALITRFNELAAARAGLNARWRELEEEARRAGAPPGRLRR